MSAAAEPSVVLKGTVPERVRLSKKLERVPADETVRLSLIVRLDQALLDKTLAQLYGPKAPAHPHFLTPLEFAEKFGLAEKRQKIKGFAAASGLTLLSDDPRSLIVKVSGPAAAVEKAFSIELYRYKSANGKLFRATDIDPSIPASLLPHLQAILGLSTYPAMHPHVRRHKPSAVKPLPPGAAFKPALKPRSELDSNGLSPSEIKTIYNVGSTFNGSGQTVALYELDGYNPSDITLYEDSLFPSAPNPSITCISIDDVTCGQCGPDQADACNSTTLNGGQSDEDGNADGGMYEVALDIEMVMAMAPSASISVYTTYLDEPADYLDPYDKMATDDSAAIVSTSWGEDEEDEGSSAMSAENTVFEKLASQGQTVYAAAGDSGAYDASGETDADGNLVSYAGNLLTDDPASQPYVTGVGGTSLSGTIGGTISETVWNDGCSDNGDQSYECYDNGAGGGGVADYDGYWAATTATYQEGVSGRANSSYRNVPDVTLNADQDASAYDVCVGDSCGNLIGGTSAAAPLWAGLTSPVNQQRAQLGSGRFGFANTELYWWASGSYYHTVFNDVTEGNNGYYDAGTGYDNASGWGSFNGNYMIYALSVDTTVTTVSQTVTNLAPQGMTVNWSTAGQVSGTLYTAEISGNSTFSSILESSETYDNAASFGTGGVGAALSPDTTYYFRVNTTSYSITSGFTNLGQVETLAETPTSLFFSQIWQSSVTLDWSANGNPQGVVYAVAESTDDFLTVLSTPIPFSDGLTAQAATVNGLTQYVPYSFEVLAENGNSVPTAPSNAVQTELGESPGSTSISATALGVSSIAWNFSANNATSYYLSNGETGVFIESTTASSYTAIGISTDSPFDLAVQAANSFGEGLLSQATGYTLAAVPTPPAATGVSTATVSLSWTGNGNPAGTPFELSMSLDDFNTNFSTPIPFSNDFSSYTATVSNLNSSTTYYFRLRAENFSGVPTAFSTVASTETNLAPPPQTFFVTSNDLALGVSSITFQWAPLTQATGYNLYDGSGNYLGSTASTNFTDSQTFTGAALSTNTAYELQVAGVNAAGQGPLTGTTVYTLAAVPASPSPADIGASQAGLSWQSDGNPGYTQYLLQVSTDPTFTVAVTTAGTTSLSAAAGGLLPNTTYNLEVQAVNGNGIATAFTASVATPTWAAAPGTLSFSQVSSAAVAVSWPANGNPAITPYEVSLSTDGFVLNDSTPLPFTPEPGLSFTLSGLTQNTSYYVRVRAENSAGIATAYSSATYFLQPQLVLNFAAGQGGTLVYGGATLVLPAGAFSSAVTITMQAPASYPAPNSYTGPLAPSGTGVEISAGGQEPSVSPTLTLPYALSGSLTDATRLVIAYYDPDHSVWVPLDTTPNETAHTVTASIPHFSIYQVMQENPSSSLSSANILVFPDPVYTSRGQTMSFTGLPAGATLTVYTFNGEKVRSFDADPSGLAVWDGRNGGGSPAASGVYMVLVKSGGDTKILKVMVER